MTHLTIWNEKYREPRPRRLLALDGGGILGVMSVEILREIERQLAELTGEGEAFRLGRYFDYIGGTSTGAITATALAVGMSVQQLSDFYDEAGPMMFEKRWLLNRVRSFYTADPLREKFRDVLGDRTLGSRDLQCLLLIVTRNATTDSPWPVTSNPSAKYNEVQRADCNLNIPLWKLVRASTAAPVYFPPEILEWDADVPAKTFVFVDGGVTPYNNPSFLLYRKATLPQYRLSWQVGERDMMLISVGTGRADKRDEALDAQGHALHENLTRLPGVLMGGASVDQDVNCRTVGRCVFGHEIDRELGDMLPRRGDPLMGEKIPLEEDCGRGFLYARYDPQVDRAGLDELDLAHVDPSHVQALDAVDHMSEMREVGRRYASRYVSMTPFERFARP